VLGVPSPYGKCDIVFVPELGPLAACLPGVITASETLLQRLADPGDEHTAMVLAHEVAHFWFGCLVEGRWWDDLWLAEALATYLSYVALGEALGLSSPWADFALRDQADAYQADTLPSTQPVSSPVATAADAMNRPSALTYSKGASIIRQLAALIGDDALRAGLRDYLTRYASASIRGRRPRRRPGAPGDLPCAAARPGRQAGRLGGRSRRRSAAADGPAARRLARLLYPATLADPATIAPPAPPWTATSATACAWSWSSSRRSSRRCSRRERRLGPSRRA
jgi:hypothetical protein